ncbi:retroviral-like aspartic protease 1 [Watersipora subatra]|uniref:retroviral-like aspartic protease 1 n=1 Tax=Watersipora subatra TaxID=2589382 RepID=UPI00355AFDE8
MTPQYTGKGDVEYFTTHITEVADANQWTEGATLLHLCEALGEQAEDYNYYKESRVYPKRKTARETDPAPPQKGRLSGLPEYVLEDISKAQAFSRPHSTSNFLPGRVGGQPIQFLLDTGCTTNLINKQVFDQLPGAVRDQLKESDSHGLLADKTRLPFYGIIHQAIHLRDVKTEEVFVVSHLSEDAMLRRPFFMAHQCSLEF